MKIVFRDSIVEDLIEALEAPKTEYDGRGLDFEGDLVKLYSQLHKTMSEKYEETYFCLLYTSPSPRDLSTSRMPSSA